MGWLPARSTSLVFAQQEGIRGKNVRAPGHVVWLDLKHVAIVVPSQAKDRALWQTVHLYLVVGWWRGNVLRKLESVAKKISWNLKECVSTAFQSSERRFKYLMHDRRWIVLKHDDCVEEVDVGERGQIRAAGYLPEAGVPSTVTGEPSISGVEMGLRNVQANDLGKELR